MTGRTCPRQGERHTCSTASRGLGEARLGAVGFALTIPAISITSSLWSVQGPWVTWWLLPGPVLGLWAMRGLAAEHALPAASQRR